MPHNGRSAQQKKDTPLLRLLRQRGKTVSAVARKIGRPRTSVSRAIHQGIFPELQKEIAAALKT
jgi:hypothetical protein